MGVDADNLKTVFDDDADAGVNDRMVEVVVLEEVVGNDSEVMVAILVTLDEVPELNDINVELNLLVAGPLVDCFDDAELVVGLLELIASGEVLGDLIEVEALRREDNLLIEELIVGCFKEPELDGFAPKLMAFDEGLDGEDDVNDLRVETLVVSERSLKSSS